MSSGICDYLIIDAPFPPSQNALKDLLKRGGRYYIGRSSDYVAWEKNTFTPFWQSVRSKGRLSFGTEVMFWTVTCPPRGGSDTDNFHKAFLDCLSNAGAFGYGKKGKPVGDNYIVSTHNERGPRIRGGLLRVFLANERHRQQLMSDYFEELFRQWLQQRPGPILNRPPGLRHRRAAFVEIPHPAGSRY